MLILVAMLEHSGSACGRKLAVNGAAIFAKSSMDFVCSPLLVPLIGASLWRERISACHWIVSFAGAAVCVALDRR